MKKAICLVFIMSFIVLSCKSAQQKRCEELLNSEPLKINSYEELVSYEKDQTAKVDKIAIDGELANREMIDEVILNNQIIEVVSVNGADGSALDGPSIRVLIVVTNRCEKRKQN